MSKQQLGNKIKAYRSLKNITQDTMAQLLYVSKSTISKWESGVAEPDIATLQKIVQMFEVDMNTFLTQEVPSETKKNENAVNATQTQKQVSGPFIFQGSGSYSSSSINKISTRSGWSHWFWLPIISGILGLVFTIMFMIGVMKFEVRAWEIALGIAGLLVCFISAVQLRNRRNKKSHFKASRSNASIGVTRAELVVKTDIATKNYRWANVINVTQQNHLKNTSRTGWALFTGFNTVNKVAHDNSPISIVFDDGMSFVLQNRDQQTLDMLKTLSARA